MIKTSVFKLKVFFPIAAMALTFGACSHRQDSRAFGEDEFKGSDTSWESLADAAPPVKDFGQGTPKDELKSDVSVTAPTKEAPLTDLVASAEVPTTPMENPLKASDPFSLPDSGTKTATVASADPALSSFGETKPDTTADGVFSDTPSASLFGEETKPRKELKAKKAKKARRAKTALAKAATSDATFTVAKPARVRTPGGRLASKMRAPKIPTAPLSKAGDTLNRYYFVRHGDNADVLAKLFYGAESHAADLEKWNGKSADWKVGSMVFYVSADQPDDKTMSSFYHENGIEAEVVELKKGDAMDSIAQERFRDEKSWREIAALNKFAKGGKKLVAGKTLKVYPVILKGVQVAKTESAKVDAFAEATSQANRPSAENILADVASADVKTAKVLPPPKGGEELFAKSSEKKKELASFDVAQPMQRHFAAMMIIVGFALAALLVVVIVRARKRANEFDFFD